VGAASGVEGAEIEKIINTEIYARPKSFAFLFQNLRERRLNNGITGI